MDELLAYVELGDEDTARLREVHAILSPQFPAMANEFYTKILGHPGASSVLSGSDREKLCRTLTEWMSSGLLGPYDEAFYDKRSLIGRRHVEIGLAQHYMLVAMNVIRAGYVSRIFQLAPAGQVLPFITAVHKLLDVELAMVLHHYQLASERKLVERERRHQRDQLAAMQTLSSGLAHGIRNPLNSAKLQLELLERRLRKHAEDPRLTDPTELAHHEIGRLAALVNDFLAFAQPPSMHFEDQDLVVVVRHALELERPIAHKRDIHLELVAEREPIHARVDSTKLHQIIHNLVRNAIEAVAAGGHVELTMFQEGDRVHVVVADDGPGMPDHVRARIYEPFFSTKESGTGLGMSIVHSLVTMHGGTIGLTSSPSGTRFDVALPRMP
ncbi:MAG: Sensor protein of zinc sigma-54-dependent two-component system [Deltaproteobacteria bacterium]|nr:Sensor protein of zinc sigma-54-dependent two-component system [Deltaproteobacteria bacterium]